MRMKEIDVCQVTCVDQERVDRVKAALNPEATRDVAKIFKALSDETRMKIAYSLFLEEELCVCDVGHIAGASTATASHHLRLLKKMGLAKYRKEGKLVFYSLTDEHVKQLISIAFEHQKELGSLG
jgi:ArsR family transcriptional regulator, lead/cadmium/zinc/bismuth-responsive transcriptional repressor